MLLLIMVLHSSVIVSRPVMYRALSDTIIRLYLFVGLTFLCADVLPDAALGGDVCPTYHTLTDVEYG